MLADSAILKEDMAWISSSDLPWDKLRNSTVLVTGATGLIGMTTVFALLAADRKHDLGLQVIALVRSPEKAERVLGSHKENAALTFLQGTMEELPQLPGRIDYWIHTACPTASAFMTAHPVEVIRTSVEGTASLLEEARKRSARGFVYLSSMEAFGEVNTEELLDEKALGNVDLSKVRSCYPESKRMCEMLCTSYAIEYGVPAMSIRLAQTFGPGVDYSDRRVFAMMTRNAISGEDIVLATKGTSRHPYLYTAQAVTAILTVLLKGTPGETYNAANPETYCSIYEMGEMVAEQLAGGRICVRVDENGDASRYPAPSFLNMDIGKIQRLGWSPAHDLVWMYRRLEEYLREEMTQLSE
jgi:nucleoside-diphosphate-sugar epimerase